MLHEQQLTITRAYLKEKTKRFSVAEKSGSGNVEKIESNHTVFLEYGARFIFAFRETHTFIGRAGAAANSQLCVLQPE